MSAIAQLDYVSDEVIYTLARRVIVYSMWEFERVWESANRICDRHQVNCDSRALEKVS